jgi:two-component system, OmpR family, alkaline phosphatase synthesis response regulator PhoP
MHPGDDRVTESQSGRARVLAVDDDPDLLLLLRSTVEGDGHEVILASDGRMALQRIADEMPDVVCLDLMMPVMDGWAVLGELSGRPDAPPVIVVSAKTSEADLIRAFELGADGYVFKPFDPGRLMDTIRSILDATPEELRRRRDRALADLHRRDVAS